MKKILMTLFVAAATIAFVGCKSGNGPSKAVDAFMTCMQNGQFSEAVDMIDGAEDVTAEEREFVVGLMESIGDELKGMTYEILEETIAEDGNSATVKVKMVSSEGEEDTNDINVVKGEKGWRVSLI